MRKLLIFLFGTVFLICEIKGQSDSTVLVLESVSDRIFLSFDDFRKNKFISKENIVSNDDRERPNFITKILASETFIYQEGERHMVCGSKGVWGFFQNHTFYINFNYEFWRVPVFGAILCFVTIMEVPVLEDVIFSGGNTLTNNPVRSEPRMIEYMMSYCDGRILKFNRTNTKVLLENDKDISLVYKELSRKKQKQLKRNFVRTYNESHPIYVLK